MRIEFNIRENSREIFMKLIKIYRNYLSCDVLDWNKIKQLFAHMIQVELFASPLIFLYSYYFMLYLKRILIYSRPRRVQYQVKLV